MPRAKKALRVAVVGATGMVGRELLHLLEARRFPATRLLPFSSGGSNKSVRFLGRALPAPAVDERALLGSDLVFFVSSDEVSKRLAPGLAARGVFVIDDSSAFRQDPRVPLVIPEVNAHALAFEKRLIAGPNCTMTGLAVAGLPLHRAGGALEARIASYQAVSGAGRAALEEFLGQAKSLAPGLSLGGGRAPSPRAPRARALPAPIAFNVFPQVGGFSPDGQTSEEWKVAAELRKVWEAPNLKVSVTAVRVPVLRGHSLAAWLTLERPLSPAKAERLLAAAQGVRLSGRGRYPTPLSAAMKDPVFVGRLRQGVDPRELVLWIVSDNLLKGAALNSVQIAERLLDLGWLGS